jgi:hypothetical protein
MLKIGHTYKINRIRLKQLVDNGWDEFIYDNDIKKVTIVDVFNYYALTSSNIIKYDIPFDNDICYDVKIISHTGTKTCYYLPEDCIINDRNDKLNRVLEDA